MSSLAGASAVAGDPSSIGPRRRKQRTLVWMAVALGALLLVAGALGGFLLLTGWIRGMASEPWSYLQQAAVASRTDDGAEAFYRQNPGLAARFPSAPAFVAASRAWRPKLAALPQVAPDLWGLARSGGGSLNVKRSNSQVTLELKGYRGANFQVVTQNGKLTDLAVQ
jgi:hypothetical protein